MQSHRQRDIHYHHHHYKINFVALNMDGKYGSRPLNGTTLGRYIHRRQFKGRVLRPHRKTTLFKGLREFHEETLYVLDLQYRSSTRRRIYRVWTSLHFLPRSSMCRTQHDRRHQALRKSLKRRPLYRILCYYLLNMLYEKKKEKKMKKKRKKK